MLSVYPHVPYRKYGCSKQALQARRHVALNCVPIGAYDRVPTVQKQIYSLDPDQPATAVQTLNEQLDVSRSQPRFTMFLLAALSTMVLVLALVGIYGLLAYMVARRVPELEVRMALGADKAGILRVIVGCQLPSGKTCHEDRT
jgi:hypothetical protein